MNIFEALSRRVFRQQMAVVKAEQDTETKGAVSASDTFPHTTLRSWEEAFGLPLDRRSRYDDFDQMDTGDVAIILDTVVDQALNFEENPTNQDDILLRADCFKIDFKSAPAKAKEVVRTMLEETDLRQELRPITRDLLKYGDEFVELLWDSEDRLSGIQPHIVRDMFVGKDNKGNFELGTDDKGNPLAYQQRASGGKVIAGWQPFEMVHFKLYPSKKHVYSIRSLLDTIRFDWKKLNWLEQGMVVARASRAYPRLVWLRDMTGKSLKDATQKMADFIKGITRKKTASGAEQQAPMQPDEDYFLSTGYVTGTDGKNYPKLDSLQMLDPTLNGIGTITDVVYLRRKLFNRVPAATVGIVDASQGDMTPQDIALAKFTQHVQRQIEVGLRQIIDRSLLAQGYMNIAYDIIFPRPFVHTDWRYADGAFRNSMKDQNYNAMGAISKQTIRMREFGMSKEESDAEAKQVLAELKEFGTLFPTNSGQGEGEGLGKLGATPEAPEPPDTPADATTKSKQKTGGQKGGAKAKEQHQHDLVTLAAYPPPGVTPTQAEESN